MAAPTWVANGSISEGTAGVAAVNVPTHQADDILLLIVETEAVGATTLTTPTDWTAVTGSPFVNNGAGATGDGTRLSLFWRRATSSSTPAPALNDTGDHTIAYMQVYRGHDLLLAPSIVATAATGSGTTVTFPALTTTRNNSTILLISAGEVAGTNSTAVYSTPTIGGLDANATERLDARRAVGNGGSLYVGVSTKNTAGSTGSPTIKGPAGPWVAVTLALHENSTYAPGTGAVTIAGNASTVTGPTVPNLFLDQDFTSGNWVGNANVATTSEALGDGSNMYLLTASGAAHAHEHHAVHHLTGLTPGNPYTLAFYIKAKDTDYWVSDWHDGTNDPWAAGQISTGSTSTNGTFTTVATEATNITGVYRATVTANAPASGNLTVTIGIATSLTNALFSAPASGLGNYYARPYLNAGTTTPLSLTITSPGTTLAPSTGAVTITGQQSSVTATANLTLAPTTGSVTVSGSAATVTASDHKSFAPSTGAVSIAGQASTVAASDHKTAAPSTGAITIAGLQPTIAVTDHKTLEPSTGALAISGQVSTIEATAHVSLTPATGAVAVTGYAPDIQAGGAISLTPGSGSVLVTGYASSIEATAHVTLAPVTGAITIAGSVSTLSGDFQPTASNDDGDGAESVPPRRNQRLRSLGGMVGRDIPLDRAEEKIRVAQKAVRKAVKAAVKKQGAEEALEQAADAILEVQELIPQTDWEGLWKAYLEAQTALEHEARVRAYAIAEMKAQAMLTELARVAEDERRRAEEDEDDAITALLMAAA